MSEEKQPTTLAIFLHVIKRPNVFFMIMVCFAFLVSHIPIISIPFDWVSSIAREGMQGLFVVITGGSVQNIQINLDGGGFCIASDGMRDLAIFASYLAQMLVGLALYTTIEGLDQKQYDIAAAIVGVIILLVAFMARELITLAIMSLVFVMFLMSFKFLFEYRAYFLLKFISIYLMIEPIRAYKDTINPYVYSDGDELEALTGYSKFIYLGAWLAAGVYFIFKVAKAHVKKHKYQKYFFMKTPRQLTVEFFKSRNLFQ